MKIKINILGVSRKHLMAYFFLAILSIISTYYMISLFKYFLSIKIPESINKHLIKVCGQNKECMIALGSSINSCLDLNITHIYPCYKIVSENCRENSKICNWKLNGFLAGMKECGYASRFSEINIFEYKEGKDCADRYKLEYFEFSSKLDSIRTNFLEEINKEEKKIKEESCKGNEICIQETENLFEKCRKPAPITIEFSKKDELNKLDQEFPKIVRKHITDLESCIEKSNKDKISQEKFLRVINNVKELKEKFNSSIMLDIGIAIENICKDLECSRNLNTLKHYCRDSLTYYNRLISIKSNLDYEKFLEDESSLSSKNSEELLKCLNKYKTPN